MRWNASHDFEPAEPARRKATVAWPDLHVCPSCTRPFVVPWEVLEALDDDRYRVTLRCMSCGWRRISEESEERLVALDAELDRQVADIEEMAVLLELTRQVEEIDCFVRALHADAILPEDF